PLVPPPVSPPPSPYTPLFGARQLHRGLDDGIDRPKCHAPILRRRPPSRLVVFARACPPTPANSSQIFTSRGYYQCSIWPLVPHRDRKSTRLNSSHVSSSYAVF